MGLPGRPGGEAVECKPVLLQARRERRSRDRLSPEVTARRVTRSATIQPARIGAADPR